MTEKVEAPKNINPNHFDFAQYKRNEWFGTAVFGTTVEDLKKPEYWANVSAKFKPSGGDIIQIEMEDNSAFFEFYVRSAGTNWANVALIREVYFDNDIKPAIESPLYDIQYKGKLLKFCVVRKSDNELIFKTLETKEQAYNSLKDYIKATAI